jgi:uncharacterized protein (TIGR02284 family)
MSIPNAEVTTPNVVDTLETCLGACMDGMNGYGVAAEDARDAGLRRLFEKYREERAEFVRVLRDSIRGYGYTPKDHGTAKGAAHRGFMEARVVLEPKSAEIALLDECERGEHSAVAAYDHAFARTPLDALPTGLRAALVAQRAAIQAACDDIGAQDIDRRRTCCNGSSDRHDRAEPLSRASG